MKQMWDKKEIEKIIDEHGGGSGGDAVWGSITGTLSNQTDLQNALDAKADITDIPNAYVSVRSAGGGTALSFYKVDGTFNQVPIAGLKEASQSDNDLTLTGVNYAGYATTFTYTPTYANLADKPDLSIYAQSSDLATVATSGSYNDLTDKPTIPADAKIVDMTSYDFSQQRRFTITEAELAELRTANFLKCISPFDGYELILPTCGKDDMYKEADFGPYVQTQWNGVNRTTVFQRFTFIAGYDSGEEDEHGDPIYLYEYFIVNDAIAPQLSTLPQSQANGDYVWNLNKDGNQFTSSFVSMPTATSDLTNDSGFITNAVSNLTNYYDKTEVDDIVDNVAADIPEVIANPATTTSTLNSILINGTSYAINGGGSGGGFNIININSDTSTTSGTLSAADLALIVANPGQCVIRKYGSSAQYIQNYVLTEIAYTDSSQSTVQTYTYELVQNPGTAQVRDRKIVVTASTGEWRFTETRLQIIGKEMNNFTLQHTDFFIKGSVLASNQFPTTISSDNNRNNFINYLQNNYSAGSSGQYTINRAAVVDGEITVNNNKYQVVSISGYRQSSSNATLYVNYWDGSAIQTATYAYTDSWTGTNYSVGTISLS